MEEMEALARELAGFVVTRASGPWLQAHGLPTGTLDSDPGAAREDLSRRLVEARHAVDGLGSRPAGMHRACPFCGGRPFSYVTGRFAKVECEGCSALAFAPVAGEADPEARAWDAWDGRGRGSDAWVEPADPEADGGDDDAE